MTHTKKFGPLFVPLPPYNPYYIRIGGFVAPAQDPGEVAARHPADEE